MRLKLFFPHLASHALSRDEEAPTPCLPFCCSVTAHLYFSPTAGFCASAIHDEGSTHLDVGRQFPNSKIAQKTSGKDLMLPDKPTSASPQCSKES